MVQTTIHQKYFYTVSSEGWYIFVHYIFYQLKKKKTMKMDLYCTANKKKKKIQPSYHQEKNLYLTGR